MYQCILLPDLVCFYFFVNVISAKKRVKKKLKKKKLTERKKIWKGKERVTKTE